MHPSIKLHTTLLLVLIFLSALKAGAQLKPQEIDSLQQELSQTKTRSERIKLLNILGEQVSCKKQQKFKYINEARTLSKKANNEIGLMKAEYNLGLYYQVNNQDYSLAIEWLENSLSLAKQNKQIDQIRKCYSTIADCYQILGENGKALLQLKKVLELDIDRDNRIQTLGNSGAIYAQIGDYPQALEHYNKAYALLNEDINTLAKPTVKDSLTLMGLKYQIAQIHVATADFERALLSFQEIRKLSKNINNSPFDLVVNIGIGDVYYKKGEVATSIQYYNEAEKVLDFQKYRPKVKRNKRTQILIKQGFAYLKINKADSALYYAKKALSIANGDNNNKPLYNELPRAYTLAGQAYSAIGKYNIALDYLNEAIASSKKTGAIESESIALLELSNIYNKTGKPQAALNAYHLHIQLRDSVYSTAKLEELTRLGMQGDFDRQRFSDSIRVEEEKAIAKYQLQKQRWLTYSGFAGVLLLLLISFIVYRSLRHVKKANKIISRAKDTISLEKQVSEKLLKNILPEEVADELKIKGTVEAKLYDPVTVLFTDFVDFTLVGERLSPKELVTELDECFKKFDEIIDKYNIEKIKTVGDAYIAVAGLPISTPNHGAEIVNAALEIAEFVTDRKQKLGDLTFNVRIGVNSGNVVAGIVGKKKFAYDIWGDTVNIAARMEQNSLPGRVNISEHTHELIKDKFNCTFRGEIAAKNKGNLRMYFVESAIS